MKAAFMRGNTRKIIDQQLRIKEAGTLKEAACKTRKLDIGFFKRAVDERSKIKKRDSDSGTGKTAADKAGI